MTLDNVYCLGQHIINGFFNENSLVNTEKDRPNNVVFNLYLNSYLKLSDDNNLLILIADRYDHVWSCGIILCSHLSVHFIKGSLVFSSEDYTNSKVPHPELDPFM